MFVAVAKAVGSQATVFLGGGIEDFEAMVEGGHIHR